MSFSRVDIFNALFDLVSNSYGFVTISRRLRLWTDVALEDRPALFLHRGREEYVGASRGTPPVTFLNADLFVYVNTKDAEVPSDILDTVLDALDAVFVPDPLTGKVTLNGLADHVYKDGQGMITAGDLDGDGIAIIPVKIRVA